MLIDWDIDVEAVTEVVILEPSAPTDEAIEAAVASNKCCCHLGAAGEFHCPHHGR